MAREWRSIVKGRKHLKLNDIFGLFCSLPEAGGKNTVSYFRASKELSNS